MRSKTPAEVDKVHWVPQITLQVENPNGHSKNLRKPLSGSSAHALAGVHAVAGRHTHSATRNKIELREGFEERHEDQ